MEDDEQELMNFCTDLVGLKKFEGFLHALLGGRQSGEWTSVQELCRRSGLAVGGDKPGLFAAWLPDPLANEAYVVVLFYDDESKWSLTAHYHQQRLQLPATASPRHSQSAGHKPARNGPDEPAPTSPMLQELDAGGRRQNDIQLALDDAARMASDQ